MLKRKTAEFLAAEYAITLLEGHTLIKSYCVIHGVSRCSLNLRLRGLASKRWKKIVKTVHKMNLDGHITRVRCQNIQFGDWLWRHGWRREDNHFFHKLCEL